MTWGGNYGKSGYMLFYERRRKKDLKVVLPSINVEKATKEGSTITACTFPIEFKPEINKMV